MGLCAPVASRQTRSPSRNGPGIGRPGDSTIYSRFGTQLVWLVGLLLTILVIGMLPAVALFMILHMTIEGRTPIAQTLAIVGGLLIGMYLLFVKLLHVPWPPSQLGDLFPALRDAVGQLI